MISSPESETSIKQEVQLKIYPIRWVILALISIYRYISYPIKIKLEKFWEFFSMDNLSTNYTASWSILWCFIIWCCSIYEYLLYHLYHMCFTCNSFKMSSDFTNIFLRQHGCLIDILDFQSYWRFFSKL